MLGVGRQGPLGREVDSGGGGADSATVDGLSEHDAWVVLAGACGVGPVTFQRLLATYGTAQAVLRDAVSDGGASRLIAASAGPDAPPVLSHASALTIVTAAANPQRTLAVVRRAGVTVITLRDRDYPSRLRRVELPPPVLFVTGSVQALEPDHAVAVVGTRRPTGLGRATAARIAGAIAGRGATVVSGLAYGIDAAAHSAAVRGVAPTVAVVGGGHEHLYPAGHRSLAAAIVATGGAVVSEFAPDVAPSRGTFPRRNRIISGLSDATVVVEAGARSGALTTAAWALEQGRSLFIVPGRLEDPTVAGSLAFLREAGPEARVVAGIAELLDDLDLEVGSGGLADAAGSFLDRAVDLGATEAAVGAALRGGLASVDELALETGLDGAAVLAALTTLELRGLALEVLGRYQPSGPLAEPPARRPIGCRPGGVRRPAA
jgi:DNA processing protein